MESLQELSSHDISGTGSVAKQSGVRKTYDDAFKVKVVFAALRETMPLNELASRYGVHPVGADTVRPSVA